MMELCCRNEVPIQIEDGNQLKPDLARLEISILRLTLFQGLRERQAIET